MKDLNAFDFSITKEHNGEMLPNSERNDFYSGILHPAKLLTDFKSKH